MYYTILSDLSMEHKVAQRSDEWFELRKQVLLTASHFGDALGFGKGKPYDFLLSLISDEDVYMKDDKNKYIQHGIAMEKTIEEVYQLLTGLKTRETGFWTLKDDSASGKLFPNMFGASPDAIVLREKDNSSVGGLVEFKAPIFNMYRGSDLLSGIPRYYMAQMQGQMFVTGTRWCDFIAVCSKTKEIILKRVHFHNEYWQKIAVTLKQFCSILKEAKQRKLSGATLPLDFQAARNLKFVPQRKAFFTGEDKIVIEDLLKKGKTLESICGPSKIEYSYDILVGEEYNLPDHLTDYGKRLLNEIDLKMKSDCNDITDSEITLQGF